MGHVSKKGRAVLGPAFLFYYPKNIVRDKSYLQRPLWHRPEQHTVSESHDAPLGEHTDSQSTGQFSTVSFPSQKPSPQTGGGQSISQLMLSSSPSQMPSPQQ